VVGRSSVDVPVYYYYDVTTMKENRKRISCGGGCSLAE